MLELPPPLLSVRPRSSIFPEAIALGFDSFTHYPDQIGPLPGLLETNLPKVDNVSMIRMRRTFVDFLASNIGKDPLGVTWVICDQFVHHGQGIGNAVTCRVVEGEALTVNL